MEFLSQHDVPFTKHSVEEDGVVDEMKRISGTMSTPVIQIDEQIFTGFSQNKDQIENLVLS